MGKIPLTITIVVTDTALTWHMIELNGQEHVKDARYIHVYVDVMELMFANSLFRRSIMKQYLYFQGIPMYTHNTSTILGPSFSKLTVAKKTEQEGYCLDIPIEQSLLRWV
jgi:hypothetical protein